MIAGYRLIALAIMFFSGSMLVIAAEVVQHLGSDAIRTVGIIVCIISGLWLLIDLTNSYRKD